MFDISPALLEKQRERLGDQVSLYVQGDALQLAKSIPTFGGCVLINGVIADLRSVYLSPDDPLEKYGIDDPEIRSFCKTLVSDNGPGFFHVGTHLLLRELAAMLEPDATAALLEYSATPLNQPSWFDTHFECGIEFRQVEAYAKRLGFRTELVDIEDVLGITAGAEFLTMDVFTRQDRIAVELPSITRLWRARAPLEVLAYTRDSLREALGPGGLDLSTEDVNELTRTLDRRFFSIHNPHFDSKNPTTWGYKCLLLKKPEARKWDRPTTNLATEILSDYYGISKAEARERSERFLREREMQLPSASELLIEAILCGAIYDVFKKYGPVVGSYFVVDAITAIPCVPIPLHLRAKLVESALKVLRSLHRLP
jgi:hypothetical protein